MRILISADPGLPVPPKLYGGIERVIDLLVRGLIERGHEIALVSSAGSSSPATERFAWPDVDPATAWGRLRHMMRLETVVRRVKPDLLHSFSRLLFLAPQFARSLPKVMSYQREPTTRAVQRAVYWSRGTLTFTGCSAYIARQGSRGGGLWEAIPNGVDLDRYIFQPSVPTEAPLLYLSRVERIKGAHTAIAAARRAKRRLVIAGNHAETGEEGRYWRDTIAPEIGHHGIEYVGALNDQQKNEWLRKAAALLVPVEWEEPFGIVFAEALACGTPVISCPRGALPEIVRPGIDGFLENDVDGLCRAIERVASIDRRQCRVRAEQLFSKEAIVDQYERLYRKRMAA